MAECTDDLDPSEWMSKLPASLLDTPLNEIAIPDGIIATGIVWIRMAECTDDLDPSEWMSKLPASLLDTPLNEIAIPGTHNSFSHGLDPRSEIGPDVSSALRTFGGAGKGIIYKWSVTQNQTFREQLDSGIRYFDLRVALRSTTSKLHFVHGLFGKKTVQAELQDIRSFLDEHSKEIVILDFNHFYDMNDGHHGDLVKIIEQVFEQRLCLCVGMESLTLNMLWENNLQVIVLYEHKVAEDICELWPGPDYITSPWPNTPSVPKMIDFLNASHKQNRSGCFHVCQGVLTPDTGYILGHLTGSLRNDVGKKAMPALLEWLSDKKPGCNGVNIVIADFTDLCGFARNIVLLNFNK